MNTGCFSLDLSDDSLYYLLSQRYIFTDNEGGVNTYENN